MFGVIFVAELPDKTALAAVVLATRYRPLPTFLGAGVALTVQSVVAVAAGRLLSLLPARPVHIGAGVLFLVFAILMWRRTGEADDKDIEAKGEPTFLRSFASVFGVVFIAEWGDLTQLGTAALAARYGAPVLVFCGATLALWCVTGLAVWAGHRVGRVLHPDRMKKVAAVVFAALGVLLLAGIV